MTNYLKRLEQLGFEVKIRAGRTAGSVRWDDREIGLYLLNEDPQVFFPPITNYLPLLTAEISAAEVLERNNIPYEMSTHKIIEGLETHIKTNQSLIERLQKLKNQ
jgi:hypothetical protein